MRSTLRPDRRLGVGALGLVACRRRVRPVGARGPHPGRPRRRARPSRFMGDSSAQVAERTYDSGVAIVRQPRISAAFASVAGYLPPDAGFEPCITRPSRQRARPDRGLDRTPARWWRGASPTSSHCACDAATTIAGSPARRGPDDPERRGPGPGAHPAGRHEADDEALIAEISPTAASGAVDPMGRATAIGSACRLEDLQRRPPSPPT